MANNISLLQGDITQANVDAIVNAANPRLLGGGGVDGAIHKAAGPSLLEACKALPETNGVRCPFGEARITPAGNLKAKYVIHTVGPVYHNEADPAAVLRSAYVSSCQLALDHSCRSVAFPAVSCGVYGYPHREAAEIAIRACGDAAFSALEIRFYLFSPSLFEIFSEVLVAK